MAITVLDPTPDPSVLKTVICRTCGAKLQYAPLDVKVYNGKDIGGGPDGREWIVCPNCNRDVTLKSW